MSADLLGMEQAQPRILDRKEAAALVEMLQALRTHPAVAWCEQMNSGAARMGADPVRFGWPGCPDLLGQPKDGRLLGVEVKGPGGMLRPGSSGVPGAHPRRRWRGLHGPRLPRRAARTASPGGQDMTKPNTKPVPAPGPAPKSRRLEIIGRPGVTDDRLIADLVVEGEATNASTALRYVHADHGELSLTDMVKALHAQGDAINRGDLSAAERMLSAQAVALNAIFAELARRAALNMGTHLGATESYMRLALKAQSQSRATVETLAAIKNPPVVYARQANINNGGQQQVNNGQLPVADHAHARRSKTTPNELLEANYEAGTAGFDRGIAAEPVARKCPGPSRE